MERKWWTLVAVAVGTFMLLLDVTIVNVALPDIERSLDASLADLQWVIDAYALTLAALQLTAGSLADRFGRRLRVRDRHRASSRSARCCAALAPSAGSSRSRARSRASAARSCSPTGLALLSSAFQGRERGTAFGVFGAVTGHRGRRRAGDRRRAHQRAVVALDLPRQHPGRHRRARRRRCAQVEESRDPHARRVDALGLVTFSAGLGRSCSG